MKADQFDMRAYIYLFYVWAGKTGRRHSMGTKVYCSFTIDTGKWSDKSVLDW
jgi:hypothetical protein